MAQPTVIRRTVAFAEAVYGQPIMVEGFTAELADTLADIEACLSWGTIPVVVDPECALAAEIKPAALVDAIIAKRNLGTRLSMAPVVIALGPGFTAGADVHAVVETKRGHHLGRVIEAGEAENNTGIPGEIGGHGADRVFHAPCAGIVEVLRDIGSMVRKGEQILAVRGEGEIWIEAPFDGVVRGMIRPGSRVPMGMKIADIDPRCEVSHCHTVSDKARAIGGGVLEALLHFGVKP